MSVLPDCLEQTSSSAMNLAGVPAPHPSLQKAAASCKIALHRIAAMVGRHLRAGSGLALLQKRQRRLRVVESVSLGDKRFVSILEVDGQSFLVGGSAASLALLATLTAPQECRTFERVLCESLPGRGAE